MIPVAISEEHINTALETLRLLASGEGRRGQYDVPAGIQFDAAHALLTWASLPDTKEAANV